MTEVWHVFTPGEAIRCPNRLPDGRTCNRAQDIAGPQTLTRVRLQSFARAAEPGSTLRICRGAQCNARLEVNSVATTEQPAGALTR